MYRLCPRVVTEPGCARTSNCAVGFRINQYFSVWDEFETRLTFLHSL